MHTSAENKIIRGPPTPEDISQVLRVGVVPEHFSTPFHLAFQEGIFDKYGVAVDAIEYPRGTGSMCLALRDNQLDVAIALTEGLTSDIIKNGDDSYRIAGTYVQTPLKWGIVTSSKSTTVKKLSDLHNKTIGISRFGSGSHIMSFLLAEREHWYKEEESTSDHQLSINFKVCGGLDDLRSALQQGSIDGFLWETFMLKHYVDNGELNQIGDISTPWPCFMVAIRNDVYKKRSREVQRFFEAITRCTELFHEKKQESLDFISKSCHLQMTDAESWYKTVMFAKQADQISQKVIHDTTRILQRAKVLPEHVDDQIKLYDCENVVE
ncbi:POT1 [Acrasis kona]|uniref:POT1 n=1 Tax=Acrasis kona TaxID=1008807 RepID=A0AAW2Z355_9EUKA